ncbi:MAG: hypothetical protein H0Z33_07035 [Bacillaceae bacterium]|nr:hypothetical protein [Bacillaceae bacterium]
MKKLSILLSMMLLLVFSSNVFASEKNSYVLEPEKDSEKVFKKMVLEIDGDTYKVKLKDEKVKDGAEGYSIKVDVKHKKYKVKKMKKDELQQHLSWKGNLKRLSRPVIQRQRIPPAIRVIRMFL